MFNPNKSHIPGDPHRGREHLAHADTPYNVHPDEPDPLASEPFDVVTLGAHLNVKEIKDLRKAAEAELAAEVERELHGN